MKSSKHKFAVALAAAVVFLTVDSAHAKPISITSCTPTFLANKPGAVYDVANSLTAAGDCIDVTANGVIINLNGFTLTGNGSGAGINIKAGKDGARIEGPGTIQQFKVGVVDSADDAAIENGLTIQDNVIGGVLLTGVDASVVADNSFIWFNGLYGVLLENTTNSVVQDNIQISYNGTSSAPGYGIWIQNNSTTATLSSHNDVIGNELNSSGNGNSTQAFGIWVGYNGTLGCPTGVQPSTDNLIAINAVVSNNLQIGIGLQCNTALSNTVIYNVSDYNGLFDGYDGNTVPPCDANFWGSNNFAPTLLINQPCV